MCALKDFEKSHKQQILLDSLNSLLIKQVKHPCSFWFRQDVDLTKLPDYTNKVQNPISLVGIRSKIESKSYLKLEEFVKDLEQIWRNSNSYNGPQSVVSAQARELCLLSIQELEPEYPEVRSLFSSDLGL